MVLKVVTKNPWDCPWDREEETSVLPGTQEHAQEDGEIGQTET